MRARALTTSQAAEVVGLVAAGWTKPAVAKQFGVSVTTVYRTVWDATPGHHLSRATDPQATLKSRVWSKAARHIREKRDIEEGP